MVLATISEEQRLTPHSHSQTARDEKGSREGACQARKHVVRCYLICALLWFGAEGYYEAELSRELAGGKKVVHQETYRHENSSNDQAVTKIMPTRFFGGEHDEGYQKETQKDQPHYVECFGGPIP
jgi:hypothetical protein